jgi:hypothetical protein
VIPLNIWLTGRKHCALRKKSQWKRTTHRKSAAHQKRGQQLENPKPVVAGVKRRELDIYETERSVLDKLQCINNNQRSFSKKIQGIHDALYIKLKHGPNKTYYAFANSRS